MRTMILVGNRRRAPKQLMRNLLEIIKEKSGDNIDEGKYFLMSLVPSFKKLNDKQKFIAKVEFLNVMRHIIFCQRPHHDSSPPQFPSYSNLPGPSAHTSYIGILPSVKIPSGRIVSFVTNSNVNTISPIKILILNSRLVHSNLLPPAAVHPLHICHPLTETHVTVNRFRTVRTTSDRL